MLPPVITALGFLVFWVNVGLYGSIVATIVSHAIFFVTLPLVMISLGLESIDRQIVEAATTMGADDQVIFRTVVLPLVRPYLISGYAFAFVLSLNEYIVAYMVAGFTVETLPIKIFNSLRYGYTPVMAAVAVVLCPGRVVVFGLIARFGEPAQAAGRLVAQGDLIWACMHERSALALAVRAAAGDHGDCDGGAEMALGLGSRCAALAVGLALAAIEAQAAQQELNALVWCDHTDPALLEPFEKQFDVKVNVKDYEGTGTALALIEQSRPGDWDVFVVDSVDVPRVVEAGLLAPLPEAEFPWADIFPELRQENLHFKDGKMYAAPEKFGYNTLAYNRAKVDPADMRRTPVLWDPEVQGQDRRLRLLHPADGHGGDRARHEARRTSTRPTCRRSARSCSRSRTTRPWSATW